MHARPKSNTYDEGWMKAVEIVPTRENNSYSTGRSRGRDGFRKLDRLGSPGLVPDVIDHSIEGDSVEKDWMKEVEIEYTRDENTDEADPLGGPADWTGASTGQAVNLMPEQWVAESLTLVADEITFCLENDNVDEELMEEAEIEYTREHSEEEVDPLGDSAHSVLPEQKNLRATLDYGCDEIEYVNVDGSCFDVKDEVQPRNSTVLFIDVYDAKSKTANVTETPNRRNSGKQRKSYACRLCNYRTSNRTELHQHCRAHHGEKSFESAVKHVGQPTRGKPGTCSVCGKRFSQTGVLMLHMKAHKRDQPNVRKRYGKIRPSWKRKKTPTSVRPEPSPNTGAEDNGIKPKETYDDTTGGVKDPLSYNEQVPENDCTAMTEKPYRCKSCKYTSSRKHDLKKHELIHSAQKLHQCTVCSYRCKRAGYLKIHMGLYHDPETCSDAAIRSGAIHRLHDCTICHYRTRQMGNLRVHMRTHTGEKPFVCKVCNERFTQNAALKVHMRNHTGEKPYLCNVCGKGFAQIAGRNHHSKTCPHPPRRVNIRSCYICNYSCTRFRDLLNHKKTHDAIRVTRLQMPDIMPTQQGIFN